MVKVITVWPPTLKSSRLMPATPMIQIVPPLLPNIDSSGTSLDEKKTPLASLPSPRKGAWQFLLKFAFCLAVGSGGSRKVL